MGALTVRLADRKRSRQPGIVGLVECEWGRKEGNDAGKTEGASKDAKDEPRCKQVEGSEKQFACSRMLSNTGHQQPGDRRRVPIGGPIVRTRTLHTNANAYF